MSFLQQQQLLLLHTPNVFLKHTTQAKVQVDFLMSDDESSRNVPALQLDNLNGYLFRREAGFCEQHYVMHEIIELFLFLFSLNEWGERKKPLGEVIWCFVEFFKFFSSRKWSKVPL